MHKFIKFLCDDSLRIINADKIESVYFFKDKLQISICVSYVGTRPLLFEYKSEEAFKLNCDEIMQQLGL